MQEFLEKMSEILALLQIYTQCKFDFARPAQFMSLIFTLSN